MTPRRKETNLEGGQSVRFYKIVALSFLFLTIALLAIIVFMSSKRATITVITKPEPVEINFTMEIKGGEEDGNGQVITTEVSLKKTFKPQSTKEEVSLAVGFVTLHNEKEYAQPLIATTRLLSPDGILFRLKSRVVVPAQSTIDAEVYADEEGKKSEIGPTKFTIPGLREDTQEFIYATSEQSMKGGVRTYGVLTSADLEKAEEELVEELKNKGMEKLLEINSELEGVFSVVQHEVKTDVDTDEEIEEFDLSGSATVVGVFYDKEKVLSMAKKGLEKRIVGDIEKVSPCDSEPTVTLGDYDLDNKMAVLNIFYAGLVELDPESKQLQKMLFFGKTKDEVRRYLLSLDHVQGVEIKFNPAWMLSVPHVAEHVNVVVKKVQ